MFAQIITSAEKSKRVNLTQMKGKPQYIVRLQGYNIPVPARKAPVWAKRARNYLIDLMITGHFGI
jgi:hypothetical protein